MQQALSNGGRLELQIDSCQLYKVDVKTGKFDCLLDENDPEINSVLKNSVWRDDFLRVHKFPRGWRRRARILSGSNAVAGRWQL